ncbi:MAG: PEP-CTERM sorting domain-containing protein [Burkholderiales bacterium]|nr:PEP-CTERM sorting domain-containing protein [Burkholderiales bacterium]
MKHSWAVPLLAAAAAFGSTVTHAAPGDPLIFSESGTLTLTLLGNEGMFNHILEIASSTGPVTAPIFVTSEPGSEYYADPIVFNDTSYPINHIGDTFTLTYTAGTEIIFRLTNLVETPLVIDSQLFSGSATSLNPGGLAYADVTIDGNVATVGFEDLFPDRNTYANLVFSVNLAPVPEPATWGLLGIGLAGIGLKVRRRARMA